MMTISLGINRQALEVLGVQLEGPIVGEEGMYSYRWQTSAGMSGRVGHRRDDGAAKLAMIVLIDRNTRKPGEDHIFGLDGIDEIEREEIEVEIDEELPDAG